MLQSAGMTPSMSAYAYLWGQHDYNANPFVLLGCKSKHTSPHEFERHGHPTPPVVTTSPMHGNTTGATKSTSVPQKTFEHV